MIFTEYFGIILKKKPVLVNHCDTSNKLTYQLLLFETEADGCNSSFKTHPTKHRLSKVLVYRMYSGREEYLKGYYAITSCVKLRKNTLEMPKTASKITCIRRAAIFRWNKRFQYGR